MNGERNLEREAREGHAPSRGDPFEIRGNKRPVGVAEWSSAFLVVHICLNQSSGPAQITTPNGVEDRLRRAEVVDTTRSIHCLPSLLHLHCEPTRLLDKTLPHPYLTWVGSGHRAALGLLGRLAGKSLPCLQEDHAGGWSHWDHRFSILIDMCGRRDRWFRSRKCTAKAAAPCTRNLTASKKRM